MAIALQWLLDPFRSEVEFVFRGTKRTEAGPLVYFLVFIRNSAKINVLHILSELRTFDKTCRGLFD